MLKKDYIFYDFKVTYVIDQKPPEESESSHFLFEKCDKIRDLRVPQNSLKRARYRLIYFYNF